jgi:hypothetical protein
MIKFTRKELILLDRLFKDEEDMNSIWQADTYNIANSIQKKLSDYATSIEYAKDTTKEIRITAKKLPKRKWKLEDILRELK